MRLSSEEALKILNSFIGTTRDDIWITHSKCVGDSAGKIAKALNLDEDYAKALGYIHDIRKKYGWNNYEGVLPHAINGYKYIKELGYDEEYAGICIKHSFLNNDINCLANDRDYTDSSDENYEFIKKYIAKEYSIYDKIICLCDLMCKDHIMTIDKRLNDLLSRHGIYKNSQYHILETNKLKKYFDDMLGYNLYNLFPEIKNNL